MQEKGLQMSFEGNSEIMFLRRAVTDLVNLTVQALRNNDKKLAKEIEPLEEVIDDLSDELKRRHVIRLKEGRCTIEMGFVLTDMTTSLERIADHCSNIGVSILESSEENIGRHAYLNSVKPENCIYIGDSEVDIQTAANAGIPCISVNWGFKSTEFLKENGATQIVSTPTELVNAISDM